MLGTYCVLDKCYPVLILTSTLTLLKNYAYDMTSVRKQTRADGKILMQSTPGEKQVLAASSSS